MRNLHFQGTRDLTTLRWINIQRSRLAEFPPLPTRSAVQYAVMEGSLARNLSNLRHAPYVVLGKWEKWGRRMKVCGGVRDYNPCHAE